MKIQAHSESPALDGVKVNASVETPTASGLTLSSWKYGLPLSFGTGASASGQARFVGAPAATYSCPTRARLGSPLRAQVDVVLHPGRERPAGVDRHLVGERGRIGVGVAAPRHDVG